MTAGRLAALLAAALLAYPTADALSGAPPVIDIGERTEPFVDRELIATLAGAELRLAAPTPREIVFQTNRPWEGSTSGYYTVFRDGDLVRLYYRGHNAGQDASPDQITCYAQSLDGIHFDRPLLRLVSFRGSRENNIIYAGPEAHNFAPFKDANPECPPGERYKAVGGGAGALYTFVSADAVRWLRAADAPVTREGTFDSLNTVHWDVANRRYVLYSRTFVDGVRTIQVSYSPDFRTWGRPQPIEFADGAPREHLYTNAVVPCPGSEHVLLSFPMRFLESRKRVAEHPEPGVSDALFMSSRDGVRWSRTFREAWIRPGPDRRNWTERSNMPAWGVVETAPGEWSLYVGEHVRWATNRLRRYTVRRHGLASIRAGAGGGEAVTPALRFRGRRLYLNMATSAAGSVAVELQDPAGTPLPGFELWRCEPLFGDELDQPVVWAGGREAGAAAGRPVRMRLVLRDADVYAFRTGD